MDKCIFTLCLKCMFAVHQGMLYFRGTKFMRHTTMPKISVTVVCEFVTCLF